MRFALRNKTKLIKAFDESYYNLLMESLKQHFKNSEEIQMYSIEGEKYQIIDVPNIQPNTDNCFQFAVVRVKYDVLTLAYYSCLG